MKKTNTEPKSVYFIGIKGIATASVAVMAKQLGYEVKGSDVAEKFSTDELLSRHQIEVFESFEPDHLSYKPELVVVATSFGANNPEVKAAKSLRLPMITMSEMLGRLMSRYEGVGVAGVHGKTTTSSLIAYILKSAGFSPSYLIGAPGIPGLDGAGAVGDGKYFIVEADEYRKAEQSSQPKFLDYPIKHVVITSIELDHPDMYTTAEEVYQAFYQLCTQVPRDGTIVACSDWPLVRRLANRFVDRTCQTYGFQPAAMYQIVKAKYGQRTTFTIKTADNEYGPFEILLPGEHNVLNATAAIVMCLRLGVNVEAIRSALVSFNGPLRRFQLLGELNGAPVIDDYAHHPTAISYLIHAAKLRYPDRKVTIVFQPHTYSRTGRLLKEFAESLQAADKVVLLNIWASAREKSGYVTIKDLVDEVRKNKPDIEYRPTLDDVATYLQSTVTSGDVVLLVGAGDVYKIFNKLNAK